MENTLITRTSGMIHYCPKDPGHNHLRTVYARRTARQIQVEGPSYPANTYQIRTPEFAHCQVCEALTRVMSAARRITIGLAMWVNGSVIFRVRHDSDPDLNAYYYRSDRSLRFHRHGDVWTANSTDLAAHETGHGLLDYLRPDLGFTGVLQIEALHEAMADLLALWTTLSDRDLRMALLGATPDLDVRQSKLDFAKELMAAIRVPARNPCNTARLNGQIDEYDLSEVFTGLIYDTIQGTFIRYRGTRDHEVALYDSARRVLICLMRAVAVTPPRSDFFAAVAGQMRRFAQYYGGVHVPALDESGERRNIIPSESLRRHGAAPIGHMPRRKRRAAVRETRAVAIGDLAPGLDGVIAPTPVSPRDDLEVTDHAVRAYVKRLIDRGALDTNIAPRKKLDPEVTGTRVTHVIRERHGQRMLTRARFVL